MRSLLLLLALLALVYSTQALSCTHDYQCQDVSENYNYMKCVNNVCACRSNYGFAGQATPQSKCSCPAPYTVNWKDGQVYCINFQDAVTYQQDKSLEALLGSKLVEVYNALVWPYPQYVIGQLMAGNLQVLSHLFADDAEGRVDPLGTFHGIKGLVEYYFGTAWLGFARVDRVDIRKLVVQGRNATIRVNIHFQQYDFETQTIPLYDYNITHTAVYTFNSNNLVARAEMINHNMAKLNDAFLPDQGTYAGYVCHIIMNQAGCTQADASAPFYTDFNDCLNFMAQTKVGSWGNLYESSIVCRNYHALLAIADKMHCDHVGPHPTKCIDSLYSDYYLHDYTYIQ